MPPGAFDPAAPFSTPSAPHRSASSLFLDADQIKKPKRRPRQKIETVGMVLRTVAIIAR